LTLVVAGTDGRTAPDLRTREPTALPVAIAEVAGPGLEPVPLPDRLDTGCRDDLLTVDGTPLPLRVSGSVSGLLAGGPAQVDVCTGPLALAAGPHLVRSTGGSGLQVDRVVLRSGPGATGTGPAAPPPPVTVLSASRGEVRVAVGPCPDGCWLVQAVGQNDGWQASGPQGGLGAPEAVRGGLNGWRLPPASDPVEVTLTWTPQRFVWGGLLASALAALACGALLVVPRRGARVARATGPTSRDHLDEPDDRPALVSPVRPVLVAGWRRWTPVAVAAVAGTLVIAPTWGLAAAVITTVAVLLHRPRLLAVAAAALLAGIGVFYAWQQWRNERGPGFGWVTNVADAHRPALLAVVLLVASVPWFVRSAAPTPPPEVSDELLRPDARPR
jgi:arabinofuranan 3-O-arabinosyltransferase